MLFTKKKYNHNFCLQTKFTFCLNSIGGTLNANTHLLVFCFRDFRVYHMGESSKFQKSLTFETPILKLAVCPLNIHNLKFKWSIVFSKTEYKSENRLLSP